MSEQLAEVLGQREVEGGSDAREDLVLYVGEFYGGGDRGPCIQLTLSSGGGEGIQSGYIQLQVEAVEQLVDVLSAWLNAGERTP